MQDRGYFARTMPCVSRWICALVLAQLFIPAILPAQSFSKRFLAASQPKSHGEVVSTTAHPAIARIIVPEKDGVSYGSGSLVDVRDDYGLVVTNWHVVRDASGVISVLFPDGFSSKADVVKVDKDWDLAALSIRKPPAAPLPMTAEPPQPGQRLIIAGYGSGDFRAAAGKCLGYNSPAQGMEAELVEVDAEARHGDSGGPILNERGEIAGVLFGTNGSTHGSHGGRVIRFLTSVLPGGTFTRSAPLPANTIPTSPLASLRNTENPIASAAAPDSAFAITEPESSRQLSAMALHPSRDTAEPPGAMRARPKSTAPEFEPPLVPIPGKREESASDAPERSSTEITPEISVPEEKPEERVASAGRLWTTLTPDAESSGSSSYSAQESPVPSRKGGRAKSDSGDESSALELLAQAWKKLGGESVWDQAKAVLALVGLLALFVQFWRMGSHPEPAMQEE
jgi:hypothetical protein